RAHAPAAVPPLVDDGHLDVLREQPVRRSQAREAGTNDRDLRCNHGSPRRSRSGFALPQSRLTLSASANTRIRFPPRTLRICSFAHARNASLYFASSLG